MKFDKAALATTLAVSAAVLAGCDQRQCVDAQGRAAPEASCKGAPTANANGGGGYGGSHYSMVPFFMLWGMSHGGYGSRGTTSVPFVGRGASESSTGAVSRGGFGGTASGHGGAGE